MSGTFERQKGFIAFNQLQVNFLFDSFLNFIDFVVRHRILIFGFHYDIAKFQFFDNEDSLDHSDVTGVDSCFVECTLGIIVIKLHYFLDFWVKQLGKEIFSAEAVFFGVFVQEAANLLAHEGDFTVDKLFDLDKCIFDLEDKGNLLFVLFPFDFVVFIELKVFLLELSELVIKVFVKEKGGDLVMIFSLFFHMQFAVVNDFTGELNEALNPQ